MPREVCNPAEMPRMGLRPQLSLGHDKDEQGEGWWEGAEWHVASALEVFWITLTEDFELSLWAGANLMWEDATLRLIGHRDRGGEEKAEGERKGNRGAHSAGGKSALYIFSSLQPLSFSLCPCLPHPRTSIYRPHQTLPCSHFFPFHTLRHAHSHLPPSLRLSSPSPSPPASPLPPSVFHRRFRKSQPLPSIYEIAHVISCPSPLVASSLS